MGRIENCFNLLHENQRVGWNLFLEKNKPACPFIRKVGALMLEGNFIFFDQNFVRKTVGSGITFTKRAGIIFITF